MALDAIPSSQNTKKPMVYAARRCSITASPWYMISSGSNRVVKTMSAMPATRKDGHKMWIRRCIMACSSSGWTSFFGIVHLALVPDQQIDRHTDDEEDGKQAQEADRAAEQQIEYYVHFILPVVDERLSRMTA